MHHPEQLSETERGEIRRHTTTPTFGFHDGGGAPRVPQPGGGLALACDDLGEASEPLRRMAAEMGSARRAAIADRD